MSMSDERVELLDEKLMQADQLKNMVMNEVGKVGESLEATVKKMGGLDPVKFKKSIKSMKSFLKSSNDMMNTVNEQVKQLTKDITKLKTMMDQVGMMMK